MRFLALLLLSFPALAMPPESVWFAASLRSRQATFSATDLLQKANFPALDVWQGDSNVDRMTVATVHEGAVNMATSGANTLSVARQVSRYRNAPTLARVVFVHVGTNDCANGILQSKWSYADVEEAAKLIIKSIPRQIVWAAVHRVAAQGTRRPNPLPLSIDEYNACVDQVNVIEQTACASVSRCVWVPSRIGPEHLDDGVHLNALGYDVWGEDLRAARLSAVP